MENALVNILQMYLDAEILTFSWGGYHASRNGGRIMRQNSFSSKSCHQNCRSRGDHMLSVCISEFDSRSGNLLTNGSSPKNDNLFAMKLETCWLRVSGERTMRFVLYVIPYLSFSQTDNSIDIQIRIGQGKPNHSSNIIERDLFWRYQFSRFGHYQGC